MPGTGQLNPGEKEEIFKMTEENNLIFGTRPVIEAIRSGKTVDKVFIRDGRQNEQFRELMVLLKDGAIPYSFVPDQKLNRLTRKNHQGVVAFLSPVEFTDIEDVLPGIFEKGEQPLLIILDRVTDVRNFGAISRSAECAGAHAIIVPARGSAAINSDAVKTSAGALFSIPVCRSHNLKTTINYLKTSGLAVIGCTEKTDKPYFQTDLNKPLAIIMGSEENGISPEYLKMCDDKVMIPMAGETSSLNVSAAAAIILFEVVRQRMI